MLQNIRIFFSKTDRAKYISHLDMARCWTFAFNRAELPLWYTQGFNPHLYMTFPLPLSLGFESDCECLDTRLIERVPLDEVKERINAALPLGICVYKVDEPKLDQKEIEWSDYDILLECDNSQMICSQLEEYLAQDEIIVSKRSKKGAKDIDVKPHFTLLQCKAQDIGIELKLRMATGITMNVNPTLLIDNFPQHEKFLHSSYRRTAVLTGDMKKFE
ncbi:MAG: TIGR03936 family radical SAM-associated protein [Oscillospiraceae bacterium]